MKKLYVSGFIVTFAAWLLSIGGVAFASSGITYQGRLLKPDGTPVTSPNVQFRMQIRTPGAEDCLMYEEIQTHDLSMTNGMFAISLGDGSGSRQDSYLWSLFDAFSNRQTFTFNSGDCNSLNAYTPNGLDNRKFRVSFNLGGGWEDLPLQTINYIPMSVESYAVGGFPASSLLRVETAGTLGVTTPLTSVQYNEILALVNGTSSLYTKSGELNGSGLPSLSAGQTITSDGSGGWQATTPLTSESDPTVEPFAKASLPTCTSGEVLTTNGTTLSCVTGGGGGSGDFLADGSVPMTGNLRLNSNWLSNDGGSEGLRVDDAGQVGIGTGSPNYPLEVSGFIGSRAAEPMFVTYDSSNIRTSGNMTGGLKIRDSSDALAGGLYFETGDGNADVYLHAETGASGGVRVRTNGADRMYVSGSGNVGIGTMSPLARYDVSVLDVNSSGSSYLGVGQSGTGTGWSGLELISRGADSDVLGGGAAAKGWSIEVPGDAHPTAAWQNDLWIGFWNGSAWNETMVLDSLTGNVGIGTVTPTEELHLVRDQDSGTSLLISNSINGGSAESQIAFANNNGVQGWLMTASTNFGIGQYYGDRFTLQSSSSSTGLNLVAGGTGDIRFFAGNVVDAGEKMRIENGGNVGIGTNAPTQRLQIGESGDGTVALANAWNTFSDLRLKTNITPIKNACEMVDQLNGYYYHWKDGKDQSRQVGVIAQEVQEVLPELVEEGSDGILTVDYPKLTAVLIEAVKELKSENEAKDRELASIKARLERLEQVRDAK